MGQIPSALPHPIGPPPWTSLVLVLTYVRVLSFPPGLNNCNLIAGSGRETGPGTPGPSPVRALHGPVRRGHQSAPVFAPRVEDHCPEHPQGFEGDPPHPLQTPPGLPGITQP